MHTSTKQLRLFCFFSWILFKPAFIYLFIFDVDVKYSTDRLSSRNVMDGNSQEFLHPADIRQY